MGSQPASRPIDSAGVPSLATSSSMLLEGKTSGWRAECASVHVSCLRFLHLQEALQYTDIQGADQHWSTSEPGCYARSMSAEACPSASPTRPYKASSAPSSRVAAPFLFPLPSSLLPPPPPPPLPLVVTRATHLKGMRLQVKLLQLLVLSPLCSFC